MLFWRLRSVMSWKQLTAPWIGPGWVFQHLDVHKHDDAANRRAFRSPAPDRAAARRCAARFPSACRHATAACRPAGRRARHRSRGARRIAAPAPIAPRYAGWNGSVRRPPNRCRRLSEWRREPPGRPRKEPRTSTVSVRATKPRRCSLGPLRISPVLSNALQSERFRHRRTVWQEPTGSGISLIFSDAPEDQRCYPRPLRCWIVCASSWPSWLRTCSGSRPISFLTRSQTGAMRSAAMSLPAAARTHCARSSRIRL